MKPKIKTDGDGLKKRKWQGSKPLDLRFLSSSSLSRGQSEGLDLELKRREKNSLLPVRRTVKTIPNSQSFQTITPRNSERLFRIFPFNLFLIAAFGFFLVFALNLITVYHNGQSFKKALIGTVYGGYESIVSGKNEFLSSNLLAAQNDFSEAITLFEQAKAKVALLKKNLNHDYYSGLAERLVAGVFDSGNNIARAGLIITKSLAEGEKILGSIFGSDRKVSLTEQLKSILLHFEEAMILLATARDDLSGIPASLIPPAKAAEFRDAVIKLEKSLHLFAAYKHYFPHLLTLLGDEHPQRYLLLFQNRNELRPTGGFIGSFALADFNDGYLTDLRLHDVYDFDGRYHEKIEPPEEIKRLTDTWRLRDSNYSPDFALSAAKAEWFLQAEGGPSADHVIAIDQSVLVELLKLGEAVSLPDLKRPLLAEDIDFVLSYIVEAKLRGAGKPKEVLKDLQTALLEKFRDPRFALQAVPVFLRAIKEKSLQAWSKNPDAQEFFTSVGLTGKSRISPIGEDYLSVVEISVGGNKSDRYIDRNFEHTSYIESDGAVVNKLTIGKKHGFDDKILSAWGEKIAYYGLPDLSPELVSVLGGQRNLNLHRVYVPAGSVLVGLEGLAADEVTTRYDAELDKTYFSFPLAVIPGEKREIALVYKLPFSVSLNYGDYRLFIQPQAGSTAFFRKKLLTSTRVKIVGVHPEKDFSMVQDALTFAGEIKSDLQLAALLKSE